MPLARALTGGNRHDSTQLIPLVDRVPPVRGKVGRPRRRPDQVTGDRAYDYPSRRRELRRRGIKTEIARRNTEHGSGLRPSSLGRRAHLRLAAPTQTTARPLRPPSRHP
jgi:hypothetical protein